MYFSFYYFNYLHICFDWQTDRIVIVCRSYQRIDITDSSFDHVNRRYEKQDHERIQTSFMDAVSRLDSCSGNELDGVCYN